MTYFEYKLYVKDRQHKIELKSKGKSVEIPPKIKKIKPLNRWEFIGVA